MAHDGSIAQVLGLNVEAAWTLFWLLFFVRIGLGFAVGIDDVRVAFRKPKPPAADSAEARTLRRGNNVVTVLNGILVLLYAVLMLRV